MRGVVIACLSISFNALSQKIGGGDLHPGNVMAERASNGAAMYKKHCSVCHPSAARMSGARIVEIMRYPPPAMPTFDNDKISDRDADAIADYIRLQISEKSICKVLYERTCSKNL